MRPLIQGHLAPFVPGYTNQYVPATMLPTNRPFVD